MKNKILLASAAALVLLSAFLFAPVRQVAAAVAYSGMQIINSAIDSTPIGSNIPSTGTFTQVQATSAPTSLNSQGAYIGWNHAVLGETDYFTAPGSGEGGAIWYNGDSMSKIMQLSYLGVLSLDQVNVNDALINGNNTMVNAQGLNLGWNESGGNGESDFVNQYQPGGVGGFNWYNTPTSSSHGSPLMNLSGAGQLTVSSILSTLFGNVTGNIAGNGTGTWTGPVVGNANTATVAASTSGNSATATLAASATQLAVAPSTCATGAQGIAQNGNAICISSTYKVLGVQLTSTNVSGGSFCTTAGTSYASCSNTINLPSGDTFSDANYGLSCNAVAFTGVVAIVQVSNFTASSFTVTIFDGDGNGATASSLSQLSCTAIHQ